MTQIAKKTKRYPSDLTDEEWERIAPLMPKPGRRGRPREVDFREVINAVRYLVRSGCGWRMLPIHFGAWQTVYGWFRELARRFLFQTIHDIELMLDRERQGREASLQARLAMPMVTQERLRSAIRPQDAGSPSTTSAIAIEPNGTTAANNGIIRLRGAPSLRSVASENRDTAYTAAHRTDQPNRVNPAV